MTAGITQSFYDFYSSPAMGYRGYVTASDTGDPGWWVWGYTAQLGNGLTATLAAEQRRSTQICDFSAAGTAPISGGAAGGACTVVGDLPSAVSATNAPAGYGGLQSPDIVGNIRIDQTWGSAQVMAAAHEVNAPYYNVSPAPISGHPGDDWGFAVGAGFRLNFPMVAQGDYFQTQVNYTHGALRYVDFSGNAPTLLNGNGNNLAYGIMSDCIYGFTTTAAGVATNGTGCNLTTAWGVNAGYEHYWTPQFHESFVGAYMRVSYDGQANNILCDAEFNTGAAGIPGGSTAVGVAGCNNNWAIASGATRFQYDVSKSLYLGVEFLYQRYYTMSSPNGLLGGLAGFTGQAANGFTATSNLKDQNNLAITARIHKDFLP
jgi:hypothetical protein